MSRQITYDPTRVQTYRDRSVNVQTFCDVRALANVVRILEADGMPARDLTASNVLRVCLEKVHSACLDRMAVEGQVPFASVEEARAFLADRGFSMRQLGGTEHGRREYMKSLVVQDRALSMQDTAVKQVCEDVDLDAIEEAVLNLTEADPAFALLPPKRQYAAVQEYIEKRKGERHGE